MTLHRAFLETRNFQFEAIADECEAVRYSKIDNPAAKAMAKERHLNAIELFA